MTTIRAQISLKKIKAKVLKVSSSSNVDGHYLYNSETSAQMHLRQFLKLYKINCNKVMTKLSTVMEVMYKSVLSN